MQGLPEDLRKVEAFRQYREIGLILLFQALWKPKFIGPKIWMDRFILKSLRKMEPHERKEELSHSKPSWSFSGRIPFGTNVTCSIS